LNEKYGGELKETEIEPLKVDLTKGTERAETLRQEASLGKVIANRVLTKGNGPVKRHIEIQLPTDMTYRAGDYLAILPSNPLENVRRVLKRFSLSEEQEITISSKAPTTLPVNRPVYVVELLKGYVELSQHATKKNLETLIALSSGEIKKKLVSTLSSYHEEVQAKQLSVLDILELNPKLEVPFATYLSLLPSMRIRQYSISSSPLWDPTHVTLTVNVLKAAPISGKPEKFLGVASNYLSRLEAGDMVQVNVRSSNTAFHLPEDPSVPIIMAAAGSGMAPMRGFIQERVLQAVAGRSVGETLLFFGCRNPEEDFLYSDAELSDWIKTGAVTVLPAFSRASDKSGGCNYVQDRVWKDRELVRTIFKKGAKVYTCGSGAVANGIKEVCVRILEEGMDMSTEKATEVFNQIQQERFATDVFN